VREYYFGSDFFHVACLCAFRFVQGLKVDLEIRELIVYDVMQVAITAKTRSCCSYKQVTQRTRWSLLTLTRKLRRPTPVSRHCRRSTQVECHPPSRHPPRLKVHCPPAWSTESFCAASTACWKSWRSYVNMRSSFLLLTRGRVIHCTASVCLSVLCLL